MDGSQEALLNRTFEINLEGQTLHATRDAEDRDSIERVLFGETGAFDRLVRRYFRLVYAIAYARLGMREAAEDLAQEVFLRLYLHLHEYDPSRPFSPWLARIARNLAINWGKAGQRYSTLITMLPSQALEALPNPRGTESERERMERREQDEMVRQLVFRLPVEQREIVLLHFMEGLSKKEIADRMGVHPSTIGRQIEKGLKFLRAGMEEKLSEALRPGPRAGNVQRTIMLIAAASTLGSETRAILANTAGGLQSLGSTGTATTAISGLALYLPALGALLAKLAIWFGVAAAIGMGGYYTWENAENWIEMLEKPRRSATAVLSPGPVGTPPPPPTPTPPSREAIQAAQIEQVRKTFAAMQMLARNRDYAGLLRYYDIDTWGTLSGLGADRLRQEVLRCQPGMARLMASAPPSEVYIESEGSLEVTVDYGDGRLPVKLHVPGPLIAVRVGDWEGRFVMRGPGWRLLDQQVSGETEQLHETAVIDLLGLREILQRP